MDLRRLRTFVSVAELSTVTKAALHLRISQSALSRQINDLEQELRVRLFDRIGRRLVLTAVGEELLGDCRNVLGQVRSLGERAELLRREDSGVLKVAASPQMIESVLSTFLPRYAERFPNVRVKLTEALGPAQVTLLERGEVHLGIRHDQGTDHRLASMPLQPDEVLAACAPSLQFAAGERIDIRRVASQPLLLLELGYSVRVQFNEACRLANVRPNILFESRAPHTLLALAEAGHGVAIIPSLLRTDRYQLTILRVMHRARPLREGLVVQWDNRRPVLPYAATFRDALAEHMRGVFSMTQPSRGKSARARKQVAVTTARGL
jgi:LysR family transcriptional regulator, nitrogen assimilation regulatory protein